jgi:glycosyltransferase involved in cell wall biosynthesis
VATRCTSWIDEYAAAGACLPVEVGDVAGLAEAMARVASDKGLREGLLACGARTIEPYRQEVVVRERDALLRWMLEAQPGQGGAP